MAEPTKIDFQHRRVNRISDFTELMEMLFPDNRNQQHAASCIFFELKWADSIVPNLGCIQSKYSVSRRILQRTRAKLSRLGLIEHVSRLNSRYGGRHGWKMSRRFELSMNELARTCTALKDMKRASKEKEQMLIQFADARRQHSEGTRSKIKV